MLNSYWRLQFVIMQNNELVDYRTVPDINVNSLAAAITAAGPGGSGFLEVDIQIVTNVNIRQVMPVDMAMTIFFVNDLSDGDEPVILNNALTIYNQEVGPGNILLYKASANKKVLKLLFIAIKSN